MRISELLNSLIESYTDDINKSGSSILSSNYNLKIDKFAKEQGQLVATFPIQYEDTIKAIRDYTKESSINAALLSDKKLNRASKIQYELLIDLKKLHYRLNEEHHVYSGTGNFDPNTVIKNKIFNTDAFISSSLNIEVAAKNNNFHRKETNTKEDHILYFILPKGYNGCFYIGPYSSSPEELEMLIFPNEKFKIIKSKTLQLKNCLRHIHTLTPTG